MDMVMTEGKNGSLVNRQFDLNYKRTVFQLDSRASMNLLSLKSVHVRNLKSSDKTLIMYKREEMKPLCE